MLERMTQGEGENSRGLRVLSGSQLDQARVIQKPMRETENATDGDVLEYTCTMRSCTSEAHQKHTEVGGTRSGACIACKSDMDCFQSFCQLSGGFNPNFS